MYVGAAGLCQDIFDTTFNTGTVCGFIADGKVAVEGIARGFEIVFGHEISDFFGLFIFITARIPELAEGLETVGFGFW